MMKSRRKNQNQKLRRDVIRGMTSGAVSGLSITYDFKNDSLTIPELDPSTVHIQREYERQSGKDKVLLCMGARSGEPSFNPMRTLKTQYAALIAIDTNTKIINGERRSVTAAYYVPGLLSQYGSEIPFMPLCACLLIDVANEVNPERVGWHMVLSSKINNNYFNDTTRLAVVVDSELGLHSKINAQQAPYYDDHILPTFATLIYASDVDSGSLPNQMLRHCDALAENLIQYLERTQAVVSPLSNGDKNFSGFAWIGFRREPG